MLNFEYREWARWPLGSSVTMLDGMMRLELKFTLARLNGARANLTVEIVGDPLVSYPGLPHTLMISAETGVPEASVRRRKSRSPVEKIVRPQKELAPPAPVTIAEGNEVIEAAGEEFLCRWVERRGVRLDQEYSIKTWTSELVPGGIVWLETQFLKSGGVPSSWTLQAFERK